MEKKTYSIQEVSRMTGLTAHTLRYYEKIGLVRGIGRDPNGYRLYEEPDIDWLEFLIRLKETGMPIQEMLRFSGLRAEGEATVRQRRELLELHERNVRKAMAELQEHLGRIEEKIALYKKLEEEQGRRQTDGTGRP